MLLSLQRTERDPMWRREMRERWRRPITLFFLTLYIAGLSWFAYSLYASLVPVGSVELGSRTRGIGHQLFISLLGIQMGAWIPFALLLAAPTITAERERHALTEYLLAGLLPRQIVRAKFASIATFIIVMCAVPMPVMGLCFPLGGVELPELFAGVLFEIAIAVTCASFGLLISVGNRRVASSMQHALMLSLLFLFLSVLVLPWLLEASFWIWLMLAGFLALVTSVIIASCEDTLRIISHNLELDEPGAQAAPSSFTPASAPLPTRYQEDSSPSPARTLKADLVEGSSWDIWIEKVAAYSAVAQREVRVGLRASRRRMALAPDSPTYQFSPWAWFFFGICGAIMVWASQLKVWWSVGLLMATVLAIIAATTGASAAFTHEREQKMLAQLQICPLSPLEIVTGKIGAMLLLVTRSWGGPLLGIFVVGLSQGVFIAVETALIVVLALLFTITLATLLSLVCHHTSIATGGALGALFVIFVLLPSAPSSLVYLVPALRTPLTSFPLGPLWIEPINVLWGYHTMPAPFSLTEALLRVVCSLLVLNALFILAATFCWSRSVSDDGESKIPFWSRDISRSWR